MSDQDIQAAKDLLRELREYRESQMPAITLPVYDDLYFESMAILDSYEFWSEN